MCLLLCLDENVKLQSRIFYFSMIIACYYTGNPLVSQNLNSSNGHIYGLLVYVYRVIGLNLSISENQVVITYCWDYGGIYVTFYFLEIYDAVFRSLCFLRIVEVLA